MAEEKEVNKKEEKCGDIKFHYKKTTFKLRACGVIEKDGKYLVDSTRLNHFYSFPGGHIQFGESSEQAVVREVKEETGIDTQITNLIAITEVFLGGDKKMLHEIDFHYLLKPKNYTGPAVFNRTEIDNGKKKKHNYKFMSIEEMQGKDFRPEHIIELLKSRQFGLHVVQDKRDKTKK